MRNNLLVRPKRCQQPIIQIARLKAGEANPPKTGNTPAQRFDGFSERSAASFYLPTAQGRFLTISAEENPGEDEFYMAGIDKLAGLLDKIIQRFAPWQRPKLWDDAVGAMSVAAILNFEESALIVGLTAVQQGQRSSSNGSVF